jgi:hypothetical protein
VTCQQVFANLPRRDPGLTRTARCTFPDLGVCLEVINITSAVLTCRICVYHDRSELPRCFEKRVTPAHFHRGGISSFRPETAVKEEAKEADIS